MTLFASWDRIFCNDRFHHLYVWDEPPYESSFNGIAISWFEEGTIETEQEFIHGMDIGFQHIWHRTGQIKLHAEPFSTASWVVRCWHENGQLERYFIRSSWKELELKRWDELGIVVEHRVLPGHVAQIPDDTSSISAVPVAKSLGIPRHLIEQPHGYTVTDIKKD